jgi:hypothetical protein
MAVVMNKGGGGSDSDVWGRGKKRAADESNFTDFDRFEKRLRRLTLRTAVRIKYSFKFCTNMLVGQANKRMADDSSNSSIHLSPTTTPIPLQPLQRGLDM